MRAPSSRRCGRNARNVFRQSSRFCKRGAPLAVPPGAWGIPLRVPGPFVVSGANRMTEGATETREALFVAALAAGGTLKSAADKAHFSYRTAKRRWAEPSIRQAVLDARSEIIARAVGALAAVAPNAVLKLNDLLKADSESVQLGAARSILELGVKLRESVELEQRVSAIEARLSQ